MVNLKKILSI